MSDKIRTEIRSWGEAAHKAAWWMAYAMVAGVLLRVAVQTAYHGVPPTKAVVFVVVAAVLGAVLRWVGRT